MQNETRPPVKWTKKRLVKTVLLAHLLLLLLSGCSVIQRQPEAEDMEAMLAEHRESIETVLDYLLAESKSYILIEDTGGTMLTGTATSPLSDTAIEKTEVLDCVRELFEAGCRSITKDLQSNAVVFEFWHRSSGDVSCGIVYAADGETTPAVEFLTKREPLSEDGWYFYQADYEQWRIDQSK